MFFCFRHVYLIYNLGTGIAKCRSVNTIKIKQDNDVAVRRNARTADLEVNGNRTSCVSQGGATQLNVASEFYLGGVPDLSQVQPRAYENSKDLRDFTGCVEKLMVGFTALWLWENLRVSNLQFSNTENDITLLFLTYYFYIFFNRWMVVLSI